MKYTIKQIKNNKHLIKTINEVFHDHESLEYEDSHPEIYSLEADAWRDIWEKYVNSKYKNLVVLDIGTGNGFVPSVIEKSLSIQDEIIFSDISKNMLNVVQKKFSNKPFKTRFLLCDATNTKLSAASVDVATVNSVLHHLPDHEMFLREIDRILRPGGILIIKHEPNKLFATSLIPGNIYRTLRKIQNLRYASVKNTQPEADPFLGKILEALKLKGIEFSEIVSSQDIQELVDIESPTSGGGLDSSKGFNPFEMKNIFFPSYKKIQITTYGYLGKIDERKSLFRKTISKILSFFFPGRGYFFDFIVEKT